MHLKPLSTDEPPPLPPELVILGFALDDRYPQFTPVNYVYRGPPRITLSLAHNVSVVGYQSIAGGATKYLKSYDEILPAVMAILDKYNELTHE